MATDVLAPPPRSTTPPNQRIYNVPQEQLLSVTSPTDLASILVPCCGQLEFTKLLVPSLLRHTRQPFELIFLDIGSLDGTAEYLAGFAAAAQFRIKVVRALTDLGIAQAVRAAIQGAHGDYLVVLNNDTIVTEGWLNKLVALAKLSPAIGLVGPMSNYAAVPQLVEAIPYRIGPKKSQPTKGAPGNQEWLVDASAVDAFAAKLRQEHAGKWMEVDRLGGFCLLLKRTVLDKTGPLNQWSDLAVFDTDILCVKARQAGFTLACCKDLFVHHFGTCTFAHGAPKTN